MPATLVVTSMNPLSLQGTHQDLRRLLAGDSSFLPRWIRESTNVSLTRSTIVVILGTAAFGAALGSWRSPTQAIFGAIKLPLVLLFTAVGNGAINGMLAPLLGLPLTFKQSMATVLASFAACGAILGGLSPLIGFLVWSSPSMESAPNGSAHQILLVTNVGCLAVAGIAGNIRLLQTLSSLSQSHTIALRVMAAWLSLNLFLGSQVSWLLRPFVGSPGLTVEFLRPDAFRGNFFESVLWSLRHLTGPS